MNRKTLLMAAGAGAGLVAGKVLLSRRHDFDLAGKSIVITGGSRGLGLEMARQLAVEGARLTICARNQEELGRARRDLEQRTSQRAVLTVRCDVRDKAQVDELISTAVEAYGGIDMLVNNAGIIQVGPVESMTLEDFQEAMDVMFWGVVYPTLAALPWMIERGGGRIVNITSIGGKVSVPHLLPYNCAKFAAVGFSEGLRTEVAKYGIKVVTIAPGLMRTGSYLNAFFKGRQQEESTWFSLGATLPGVSMGAERAARQIVRAAKRGVAEKILTTQAGLMARFHGLFPGATQDLLALVDRLLPDAKGGSKQKARGMDLPRLHSSPMRPVTALGRSAAERMNQYDTPVTESRP